MHLDMYTCLSMVCLPISSRNGLETGGRDEVAALDTKVVPKGR